MHTIFWDAVIVCIITADCINLNIAKSKVKVKNHMYMYTGQNIDTIRNGYETLTESNAKYSGHHVTMLVSPMDAKLITCFVL